MTIKPTNEPIKGIPKKLQTTLVLTSVFLWISTEAMFGKGPWISKIDKDTISLAEFNLAYKGVGLFGILTSPIPISDKKVQSLMNNKQRRSSFLRVYEDEHLILREAKNKKIYSEAKIQKKVSILSRMIKRQLIIKEFLRKTLYPKIKISQKEANKIYEQEKKKRNPELMQLTKRKALSLIKEQLKVKKLNNVLKKYLDKLRLESSIIHNEKLVE